MVQRKSYCGQPDCPGRRACKACRNIYARANRPKYSELSPEEKRKANCRSYTKMLLKRGKLTKGPCEVCGSPDVQAHHDDYNDPRTVRWHCRDCHLNHHEEELYRILTTVIDPNEKPYVPRVKTPCAETVAQSPQHPQS